MPLVFNCLVALDLDQDEIMIMLASERNIEQVLLEFKEYASEVDVDFVRFDNPSTDSDIQSRQFRGLNTRAL